MCLESFFDSEQLTLFSYTQVAMPRARKAMARRRSSTQQGGILLPSEARLRVMILLPPLPKVQAPLTDPLLGDVFTRLRVHLENPEAQKGSSLAFASGPALLEAPSSVALEVAKVPPHTVATKEG